jgi:N-acetylmuramoyl-L-alanine amidase
VKKSLLISFLLFLTVLSAAGDGWAAPRLLKVRKWSSPEFTRVVLDLDAPAAYEIQSAASASILVVYLPDLLLPQGPREILIEDRVIRKVMLDAGERTRVTFFLYQPTRWKVFPLRRSSDGPDRLVIDIFKPAVPLEEKAARLPLPETGRKIAPPQKTEGPPQKPPEPSPKPAGPPAKMEETARMAEPPRKKIEPPPKAEDPPRPVERPLAAETPPRPAEKSGKEAERPPAVLREEVRAKEGASPRAAARLLEIRQWAAPDHTRVVIDLEGAPQYELVPGADPLTHSLILRGTVLSKGAREIAVADQVIRTLKLEAAGRADAKLTVFLVKPAALSVFLLKPYQDKPDRLVIDVSRPDLEEKEKAGRQVSRELKAGKKKIIVLDPGHGGEDPGAIGPRGTMEKEIVLSLAQGLQKVLDSTGETRAFLTRRGDYFVPLSERVKIAQEYGADLFISLHANGSRSRQTRGTSIYCLSLKGASDTATQLLAQKENASDLIGGMSAAPAQRDLDSILLDLKQTHSINESLQLGGIALSELGRVNAVQFSTPRQAGFAVLKAPEFPAILVETAYITHPNEESLLRKKSFQEKISQAIFAAVKRFIPRLSAREEESGPGGDKPPRGKRGT